MHLLCSVKVDKFIYLPISLLFSAGPFKPCDHLFGSWLIRTGVWLIVFLAFICNGLVIVTIFRHLSYIPSIKLLIGLIAIMNTLMGLSSGVLATVDALTFGNFAQYGAWWESGIGCHITGFLSVFAAESSIFLLTVAALERGLTVKCSTKFELKSSFISVKLSIVLCFTLALVIAVSPLLSGSAYGTSPLCFPLLFGDPSSMGFMVALVLLNSLCFLVMTVAYTKLYCTLEKGELENAWDCSMVKHIALLLFTNCILYCPVAFLSFSSLLNLTFISPEVIKSILLLIIPLPACLNPLFYILFNPHFKEDIGSLKNTDMLWNRSHQTSLASINSEDAEKQSCDSTQALVTFAGSSISYELPISSSSPYRATENSTLSSAAYVPCQWWCWKSYQYLFLVCFFVYNDHKSLHICSHWENVKCLCLIRPTIKRNKLLQPIKHHILLFWLYKCQMPNFGSKMNDQQCFFFVPLVSLLQCGIKKSVMCHNTCQPITVYCS